MPFSSLNEFAKLGLPREIWGRDEALILEFLETSYEEMVESFRAAGIDLPIPEASASRRMKEIECWLAAYRYMFDKFDPTNEADKKIRDRWDWARQWLDRVASKAISPLPLTPAGAPIDANPDEDDSVAGIVSNPPRGWDALLY
jgi:hypothetical protein